MKLNEWIYQRKSVRSYTGVPVDEATVQRIKDYSVCLKPLYPDIQVRCEIVGRDSVKCICPWTTPQLIAVFSEDREGALENVGFMYQQLDLYIQSLGLGACWLGMGKLNRRAVTNEQNDGLAFVIMLAFGHPKGDARRHRVTEFKRRSLSDISDRIDARLEPARLAPSSINSQPWYFTHEGETVHAYCRTQGLLGSRVPGDMNLIDMGICLSHMYVANPDTFRFFRVDEPRAIKGYVYVGSFVI